MKKSLKLFYYKFKLFNLKLSMLMTLNFGFVRIKLSKCLLNQKYIRSTDLARYESKLYYYENKIKENS